MLLKPGPLDREERILMNQHPAIGAEIVAPAQQLAPEAPLIRDPPRVVQRLRLSGWHRGARHPARRPDLTIADAYEAMTSSRPYRLTPLTHEQAVGELEKFSGIQFDPEIVPVLVGLDRETLDRPPDRPDYLPTMLRAEDPRDDSGKDDEADAGKAAAQGMAPEAAAPRQHRGNVGVRDGAAAPAAAIGPKGESPEAGTRLGRCSLVPSCWRSSSERWRGEAFPGSRELRLKWLWVLGLALAPAHRGLRARHWGFDQQSPDRRLLHPRLRPDLRLAVGELARPGLQVAAVGIGLEHARRHLQRRPHAGVVRRLAMRPAERRRPRPGPVPLPDEHHQLWRLRASRRPLRRRGSVPGPATCATW